MPPKSKSKSTSTVSTIFDKLKSKINARRKERNEMAQEVGLPLPYDVVKKKGVVTLVPSMNYRQFARVEKPTKSPVIERQDINCHDHNSDAECQYDSESSSSDDENEDSVKSEHSGHSKAPSHTDKEVESESDLDPQESIDLDELFDDLSLNDDGDFE